MTTVKLHLRAKSPAVEVDLDTLTPRARALAEAIHMSFGQQPLGVLCDTDKVKGDNPHFAYMHGTGPAADELAAQPETVFITNFALLHRDAVTSPEEWLEQHARSIPLSAWPVAGAESRMRPLPERVPSADAAREDRCLTRDQAMRHLADAGIVISPDAWILLWKAGNLPAPRHFALGGRMPLWHVDDLDAYAARPVEPWTTEQVAAHLGYTGDAAQATARKRIGRWGLSAIDRDPTSGGKRYAADQVRAAHQASPGKGRHGATRDGGRFTTAG